MKIFKNENTVFVRDGESCGIFRIFPDRRGEAEVEILVYRFGHLAFASEALISGGRLPLEARAPRTGLFKRLLLEGLAAFSRKYRLWCDPTDDRRASCYRHMLDKAGIAYRVFAGQALEIL